MKKRCHKVILTFLLIIVFINLISASIMNELFLCKKECMLNRNLKINDCNNKYDLCRIDANYKMKECLTKNYSEKILCIKNSKVLLKDCISEKNKCKKILTEEYTRCDKKCINKDKNITCNQIYKGGDKFLQGCNICECNYNGKISCKTTEYCNFEDFKITKEVCEQNNGLFQALCSGSIYSMKCTSETFCQCSGNFNYSCPEGYYCLKDFFLNKNKRGQFSQGWVKLPQIKLGDIGICVKIPTNLNLCGNNICDNIVCIGENCSFAETKYNCPNDCKE